MNTLIDFIDTNFENDHGIIEKHEYFLSYNTSFIFQKDKWKNLSAIALMRWFRKGNGILSIKDHFYIISKKINIVTFRDATRNRWNIECGLHWILDVILGENHSKNKKEFSIDNISDVKKIVFNIAKLDNSMSLNLSLSKKITRYNHDFKNIENLIFHVLPSL